MEKSYDAFITYRGGQDGVQAQAIYEIIKGMELVPAIDSCEFCPTKTFLDEMARCIAQSHFTVALISSRYATGQFVQEEAVMQKVLDGKSGGRSLLIAYIEDVEAPLWMQGFVGVRLYKDEGSEGFPELKKMLRLISSGSDRSNKLSESMCDEQIDRHWKSLSKTLLEYGIYGAAGYGVLSAVAPSEDSTVEVSTASDTSADGDGLLRTVAGGVKNLIDDLF